MQREHKFLPLAIALVAGLAVSIVFILNHNNSITSVLIVLAVMLGSVSYTHLTLPTNSRV